MFFGSIAALVTPMNKNGGIDIENLEKLVGRQIKAGTQALAVNGTTGEAPSLSLKAQKKVIQTVLACVNHKIPVIAGTGSCSTQETIENTKAALSLGVDACLIITPYYNKPSQEGLYAHYKKIAESVSGAVILYNAPSRTGCDLLPETVEKLRQTPNIVALKECVSAVARIEDLLEACEDKITLLSGNDAEALPAMLLGFKGVISVTANISPELMRQMCDAALAGDKDKARQINRRLRLLHQTLFVEANPVPVKFLLSEMNLIQPFIRLPLTPLAEKYHLQLKAALLAAQAV